jgi:hypothetical protein
MSTYDDEYIKRLERQVRTLKKQLDAARYVIELNNKFRLALLPFVQDLPQMSLEAAIKQAKIALKG